MPCFFCGLCAPILTCCIFNCQVEDSVEWTDLLHPVELV